MAVSPVHRGPEPEVSRMTRELMGGTVAGLAMTRDFDTFGDILKMQIRTKNGKVAVLSMRAVTTTLAWREIDVD